jgi:catechol 1,2-dioxygenase
MAESRAAAVTRDLIQAVNDVVAKHKVTHAEYRAAIDFIGEAFEKGEQSLLFDAFVEADVVAHNAEDQRGTLSQVLGPFYLPDTPWIENGKLASDDEPGDRLVMHGTVRGTDGKPLEGAVLDFWQADAQGAYSNFSPGAKDGNLRGRLKTNKDGSYELHTVVPAAYTIPHQGPTGRLLEELGRHPWRPAHVHLIASHEGYRPLITQVYFKGDKYLESDAVRAARPELN